MKQLRLSSTHQLEVAFTLNQHNGLFQNIRSSSPAHRHSSRSTNNATITDSANQTNAKFRRVQDAGHPASFPFAYVDRDLCES